MMRAMFSGVSGSKAHQVRMDVIGNNIANINTIGFKASRVTFHEVLCQTIKNGAAPVPGGRGGVNPMQVGLGTGVRSIDTFQTQGNLEPTDLPTDLAIEGAGFFVVSDGEKQYFTRDGAFKLDAASTLVNPSTGYRVQGWVADAAGRIDTTRPIQDIRIPLGEKMLAKATANVKLRGNLDAGAVGNGAVSVPAEVFDSLGNAHDVKITFTKTSNSTPPPDYIANSWDLAIEIDGSAVIPTPSSLTFDTNGQITPGSITATFTFDPGGGAAPGQKITLDFSTLTQYNTSSGSVVSMASQDGFPPGSLEDFSIADNGLITGIYTNGQHQPLGQIVLANFANPAGLERIGSNMYRSSDNSGAPLIGMATTEARGKIVEGSLEMSNVDLAREFTDMIITQRGFQANSRIITTADEMLQDLLTLKR
ncbi:MAG TPA: flagellar hook protein FlgE [Firmicutes bacterium]|nr:flagellar hook protein FlgE [Bacillota bacterium]